MQHSPERLVQDTAPLKILLAEDNPTNQKLALRQLQILGYRAHAVTNGKAAIEAAAQAHYDLILMDCQMPILDGFDATLAIRAWEQCHSSRPMPLIVVAMTASDSRQDRERAIAVGMDDYLTKPVHKEMLAVLLEHWSQMIAMNLNWSRFSSNLHSPFALPNLSYRLSACLDLDHLHCLSDNKPEFELELLQIFLEDSRRHLEILKHAVSRQDIRQIQQSVHHIRGASANVGARAMQIVAERLEEYVPQKGTPPNETPQNGIWQELTIVQELTIKLEFALTQIQEFVNQMTIQDESLRLS